MKRRIAIDYNGEHDIAILHFCEDLFLPRTRKNLIEIPGAEGVLILHQDDVNRILALEVRGALGLLLPAFLLDGDDPAIDWSDIPSSLMKRVRSIAERMAIAEFITRAQERAATEGRPLDIVISEDLKRP